MATPSSTPFYGSSTLQGTSMTPVTSSTQRVALDNIIRRELKVGDPNDPKQVAEALLTRYKDTPRAQAISQEAKGLPFLLSAPMPAMVPQAATSSDAELQQAKDDVDCDLRELTTNSLLKDVTPELQGWAQAVRSAIQEGTAAARFALDTRQRDKAFAIRRQLGDYARVARLVGTLTPTLNLTYRKFAQSLDEIASVLLVMMGEALANVGFNGGRFLLQAPFSELQVRRDVVIYALRNLIGATQQAYGPNDWPRGLDAYRNLFQTLEDQGQGDLRSLLLENELARTMDELIQRAAHGTADGLRALGSTAQLDVERFRRLVIIGQRLVSPESPPLTAFLEALQLFTDAFESSGGFRLMRIARPPILFYGLYGIGGLEDADHRLLRLIIERGRLAEQLDCFMQCGCTSESVICQVILDKILYDVDRAIDLYAVGKDDFGQPERRAAAYSYVIQYFREEFQVVGEASCAGLFPGQFPNLVLQNILRELRPDLRLSDTRLARLALDLRQFSFDVQDLLASEDSANPLVGQLQQERTEFEGRIGFAPATGNLDQNQVIDLTDLTELFRLAQAAQARLIDLEAPDVPTPTDSFIAYLSILQQELCIQRDMEERWDDLVRTMAPNCFGIDRVLERMGQVIEGAIDLVSGIGCPTFKPSIPPHFETSLDSIVDDVDRTGLGRPL
jgi:hypothetical protein